MVSEFGKIKIVDIIAIITAMKIIIPKIFLFTLNQNGNAGKKVMNDLCVSIKEIKKN